MHDDGSEGANDSTSANDVGLHNRLAELKVEHMDLDASVEALNAKPQPDQIQIARLKKKKLLLKDMIARIEDQLMPDIIA